MAATLHLVMDVSPSTPPPPLKEGRYRLEEVLGEGGMATVYRAFDERLQVPRAIKVLTPAMAKSPKIRDRFLSEARTMARLAHPHIVGVVDVDEEAGRPFMVMELLTGGTLWGWVLDHGPMPPRLAVDAVLAVLDGLAAAHATGVVHRDIKPQNVLLSDDGVVKLTDFGIARVDSADHRTRTAAVMGTWTYMPPEQRSSARDVDGRADLYAVGAMVYALVTATDPPDLFAADMDAELLAPLPEPLRPVVRQATRYRRDDRFASAAAMAEALRALREQLPTAASGGRPVAAAPRRAVTSLPPLSDQLAAASLPSQGQRSTPPAGTGAGAGLATVPPPDLATIPPPPAPSPQRTLPPGRTSLPPGRTSLPPSSATIAPPLERVPDGTLVDAAEVDGQRPGGVGASLGLVAVLAVALVGVVLVVRAGTGDDPAAAAAASPATASPATASPATASPATASPASELAPDAAGEAVAAAPVAAPAVASGSDGAPAASTAAPPSPTNTTEPAPAATATDRSGEASGAAAATASEPEASTGPAASEPAAAGPASSEPAAAAPAAAAEPAGAEPAATEPAATEPASGPSSGPPVRVSVTGKVSDLVLVRREDGRRYPVGEVPPGSYSLEGRWFGDEAISTLHEFRLISGWDKALKCSDRTRTCR